MIEALDTVVGERLKLVEGKDKILQGIKFTPKAYYRLRLFAEMTGQTISGVTEKAIDEHIEKYCSEREENKFNP